MWYPWIPSLRVFSHASNPWSRTDCHITETPDSSGCVTPLQPSSPSSRPCLPPLQWLNWRQSLNRRGPLSLAHRSNIATNANVFLYSRRSSCRTEGLTAWSSWTSRRGSWSQSPVTRSCQKVSAAAFGHGPDLGTWKHQKTYASTKNLRRSCNEVPTVLLLGGKVTCWQLMLTPAMEEAIAVVLTRLFSLLLHVNLDLFY